VGCRVAAEPCLTKGTSHDALRKTPWDRKLPSLVKDGIQVLGGLAEVPREDWDALLDPAATPFVRWDWIDAMERSRCASERSGWSPRHLALFRRGRLVAAAPAWVKEDSDGDFARDWDWAGAAARAGLPYYPKLCVTVPFTPCTGRRVLVAPGEDRAEAVRRIADGARALCRREGIPSLQILFATEDEARHLGEAGLSLRMGFQFHWRNEGYRTPEDFLARFRSKDRNAIKRERRAPQEQGIAIRTVRGDELSKAPREWAKAVHELHSSTVRKLMWGRGWLNRAFYDLVFERMPDALEVVEARRDGKRIAGAFNVAGKITRSCTSTCACTTRSTSASGAASPPSKAAREATTSCRGDSCPARPGARTPSWTPGSTTPCAAPSPPRPKSGNARCGAGASNRLS